MDMKEMLKMSYELYEENKDTWSPMTPEHGKTFLLYMIEEMGEVISIIKKKGEDQIMNDQNVRGRFVEEMCDIMMYYSDVLNRFDVSAEEYEAAYKRKFEYNINRNYRKDHEES